MGKNQAYKAMQRARLGSSSAGPEEVEDGMLGMLLVWPVLILLTQSHGKSSRGSKRAQLDAERARKLAHGRNHSSSKSNHKKDRKEKDSKKRSSRKRKHSRRRSSDSSSSSSSSDSSSSDDEERESRRSKSRSKRTKKEKKHRSRSKHSGNDEEEADGPVPLSRFFGSLKS
ncbi:protein FAM133 isoform X3 [Ricinus communis]|uniref:protein FAM133 isoform X3 n=1 Tax=Ricinus communis TaxID=3988 RepID=UPI000772BD9C|nr:protein FAM133 isoform X3 [Ricinus communis]|eukprot:XP_015578282.1 protein FAM133 isoform X3 [Ricinus communis]